MNQNDNHSPQARQLHRLQYFNTRAEDGSHIVHRVHFGLDGLRTLAMREDVAQLAPIWSWQCEDLGRYRLALDLALDVLDGDEARALAVFERLADTVVAALPAHWTLRADRLLRLIEGLELHTPNCRCAPECTGAVVLDDLRLQVSCVCACHDPAGVPVGLMEVSR